jgi:hypothetical protein
MYACQKPKIRAKRPHPKNQGNHRSNNKPRIIRDHIQGIIMGVFEGSARLLGEIIGFGITAVLFVVCALPIYFILKKISGSKTTFTEDLKEYLAWRWRPQPRPKHRGYCPRWIQLNRLFLRSTSTCSFSGWCWLLSSSDGSSSTRTTMRHEACRSFISVRLLASGRLGRWQPGDDQTAARASLACRNDSNRRANS